MDRSGQLQANQKEGQSTPLDSWEEIVRGHQRYIYNLAYHLLNDRDEADDLTQETFLKAFEHLAGFRGEASLRTWLTRIALNNYLAKKRKYAKHESITLETVTVPDWSGNPERLVIRRELQWCIRHILQHHLPQDQKIILILRDVNRFSYEEVSRVLGISVSAVKSRLHRARKAFKNHLVKSGCAGLVKDYTCCCEGVLEL